MAQKCDAYRDLLRITAGLRKKGFLTRFQSDLIKHDKRALRGYCGPYMWAIGESMTYLATPKSICRGTGHVPAWRDLAKGDFGKMQIFHSMTGGPPKRVTGGAPVKIAQKWVKACRR